MLTIRKPATTIERMFDEIFNTSVGESRFVPKFIPKLDIRENQSKVVVNVELPGVDKADVKVVYEEGMLKISGEKRSNFEQKDERCYQVERSFGEFSRSIPLNKDYLIADSIEAKFSNGLLIIEIAKTEKTQPKQIEIKID